eukprot:TRINITY_DN5411_c1_g2_i1.p1 TRINITY_DN5411_c1_g2~~TRINITY_DN5411_c1_g2_i1.p1  ORF type:complete len:620 (+),score=160.88 TRINITY_DN5411_c1_g2_i1:270-1862(+)
MVGADIAVVEWVSGEAVVSDRYAISRREPTVDSCGNEWNITGFTRQNGVTTGTLQRPIAAGNTQEDRPFVQGSMQIILAYGVDGQNTVVFHGERHVATTKTFLTTEGSAAGVEGKFGIDVVCQTVPPTSVPTLSPANQCYPSDAEGYLCMVRLDDNTVFHWKGAGVVAGVQQVRVLVTFNGVLGWSAIGFPSVSGEMIGAKALANDGTVYDLTGKTVGSIRKASDRGAFGTSSDTVVTDANGRQTISFITAKQDAFDVIAAYHYTIPFPLQMHQVRLSMTVHTVPAVVAKNITKSESEKVKAHGGVMIAIWAYIAPFAIVVKNFGGGMFGEAAGYPLSHIIYTALMLGSVVTTTAFFAVAAADFKNSAGYTHKPIGVVVLILAWVQVLVGVVGPSKGSVLYFPLAALHRVFGVAVMIFAIAEMATGLQNIEDMYSATWKDNMLIAMVVGLALTTVLGMILGVCVIAEPDVIDEEDSPQQHEECNRTEEGVENRSDPHTSAVDRPETAEAATDSYAPDQYQMDEWRSEDQA